MRTPNPKIIWRKIARYIFDLDVLFEFNILILYVHLFQEGYATWIADNHNEFENLTVPWTVVGRKPIPDWLRVSNYPNLKMTKYNFLKWQNIKS